VLHQLWLDQHLRAALALQQDVLRVVCVCVCVWREKGREGREGWKGRQGRVSWLQGKRDAGVAVKVGHHERPGAPDPAH
jgi:hypothetical protein